MTGGIWGIAAVCFLIATFIDVEVHQKALSIFLYLLALIPIILAILMLMVLLYALYMMYTRRDNIKLTLDLKNKDTMERQGLKLMPSDNYEWIVCKYKAHRESSGVASIAGQTTIKIGPKKDATGASTDPKKDTSKGLLGNLDNVDFD